MQDEKRSSGLRVWKVLFFNCLVALAAPLLTLWLNDSVPVRRVVQSFGYGFVYANCIGTLGYTVMPRLWPWSMTKPAWIRYVVTVAGLVGISLVGSMIGAGLLTLLGVYPAGRYWHIVRTVSRTSILLSFVFGGSAIFYETMKHRLHESNLALRTRELERERALKLATEAQLSSLESRLHPHFLFNALNSISSLIREDPERAERLIERMSAILRFSLDSNTKGIVPLEKELRIVRDYLDIESARFGPRLRFQINVPETLLAAEIPPFAVQTLVENSVKYAVAARREGGDISVSANESNGRLTITVTDDGPGFDNDALLPSHGLDTLKSRLYALHHDRASLRIERGADRMTVSIELPMKAALQT